MQDLTRRSKRTPKWLLNSLHAGDLPASTPIPPEGVTLGRDEDNSYVIPAQLFPGVSGHHARLEVEDGALFLVDLDSSNGTLVAGRAIEREELKHGANFELGSGGPRFVVISSANLDKTVTMPRPQVVKDRSQASIGTDTMHLVRENLGIPESSSVAEMVTKRSNKTRLMMLMLTLVLVAGIGVTYKIMDRQARDREAAHQADQRLQASRLLAREAKAEAARLEWQAEKQKLEEERERLELAISGIQEEEASTSADLKRLRGELEETNSTLEMYNPLNLEQAKLREVERVERCTVLIEADLFYVDKNTGRILHVEHDGPFGSRVNLADKGEVLKVEATGSGFSLTPDGWVITNAHVVHMKHAEPPIAMGPGVELESRTEIRVVFSGESLRHEASLVQWVADGREDLALLKIEPFEGMPFLEPPLIDAPPPSKGTEVYLIGFPLGKRVFHQGDTMLASTFKGVLSRVLDEYLQVDAAVHPGASGGPLIDGRGRILGVVVGMQTVEENASSSAIGYIIPVADLSAVWPPPERGD